MASILPKLLLVTLDTDKTVRIPDIEKTELFLGMLLLVSMTSSDARSKLNSFCSEVFCATNGSLKFMELIFYAYFCRYCSDKRGSKPLYSMLSLALITVSS